VATLFAHFFLHEYLNGLVLGGVVLVSIGVVLTQVFRPSEERQARFAQFAEFPLASFF